MDRNPRLGTVQANGEQNLHASRRPSSDRVFATIRLANDAGSASMNHLGQDYYNLSYNNRKRLNIGRTEAEKLPPIQGVKNSVRKPKGVKPTAIPANRVYDGQWDLEYEAESTIQSELLYLTLGIGYDDRPDRGIDILVTYPGKPTHGVLPVHAIIRAHIRSGILMLEGFSDVVPVRYMEQNRMVALHKEEYRCLWETDNRFFLNDIEVILTYTELSRSRLDDLRHLRDTQIYLRDLPIIHPELPLIPPKTPLKRHGDIIVFKTLGSGSYGVVALGPNIKTGEPCAVKTVWLRRCGSRNALFKEAELSFKYPGKPGVIQASLPVVKELTSSTWFCRLGLHDFKQLNLNTYKIESLVELLKGPAEGLELMHKDPHAHRDVQRGNLIALAENCGALSDFGKAEEGDSHTSSHIGPACTRAPDIDGKTAYGNKIDVWSYGYVVLGVLFNDVHKWKTFNREAPQSRAWTTEAHEKLDKFSEDHADSPMHSGLAQVVKMMLTYDAEERPSINEVLKHWPGNQVRRADSEDRGPPMKLMMTSETSSADTEDQGPPKKIMKTSESTKKTTKPSSVERTLQRRNRDDGIIPLEKHTKAFETLEKAAVQDRKTSSTERQSMGFTAINAPQQPSHLPIAEDANTEIQKADDLVCNGTPLKESFAEAHSQDHSAHTEVGCRPNQSREPPFSQRGEDEVA